MSAKHTPGPWDEDDGFIFAESTREPVARMLDYTGHESEDFFARMDANARLIIAAPELLADLCEAASTLRRYEALHRAKGTADSDAKAEANAALATRFEATILKATTQHKK